MSAPLVLALPLVEGETLHGYVSRNATLFEITPRDFCTDLGMRWPFLCSGHDDQIERLAWLIDHPRESLQRWSAQRLSIGRYRVGRTHSSTGVFRRTATRLCPICVEDALTTTGPHGVFKLLEWSVLCLHRCHKHGCALVPLPPATHSNLTYDVVSQVQLHEAEVRDAAQRGEMLSPTSFEAYVRQRIWEGPQADWLNALDLTNLHRASQSLGAALEGVSNQTLATIGRDDERALCQRGFEALQAGPESFTAAMEHLRSQSTAERPYYSADLGPFYHWLREVYDDPSIAEMTRLSRQHIFRTYPVDLDKDVFGERPTQEIWLTMEDARKRSRFGAVFLKKLLGHMKGVPEVEALKRTDVHVDEIAEILAFWEGLVNFKDAASRLAITPAQVKALMKLGVLPSIQITSSLRYTQSKAVDALLGVVEQVPTAKPDDGFLPLRAFCRRDGVSLPNVVKAFTDGALDGAVMRAEGSGLHALHVALNALSSDRNASLTRHLTLPEAAAYLRINIMAIRKLRDAGHLTQIQQRNPDTNHLKNYLTQDSIKAFEQKWITLGQLAEAGGVEPYHLARRLDRGGVATMPCVTGFVRVYERGA
jgi:hypothetical protein